MGLLTITLLWDVSGLDMAVMQLLGNADGFALRHQGGLEQVLHDGMRHVMTGFWGLLWAWALWPGLRMPKRERWTVLALATLSLAAVNLVKNTSLTSCPWDLQAFGGSARHVSHWAWGVSDGGSGRCFPGGHASSGFAFMALCLPWLAAPTGAVRRRTVGLRWLAAAVFAGLLAGAVQTLRGAHFPSHTLWTWLICASVSWAGWRLALPWLEARSEPRRATRPMFAPGQPRRPASPGHTLMAVLRPLWLPMACMLAALWISRLGLMVWQADRIAHHAGVGWDAGLDDEVGVLA